jgi:F0F1-type ATP synthase membrane subunit b/b'
MNFLLLLLLQEEATPVKTPNAMATHNWFVILAVGAFLFWSISYSLHLQREALKRKMSREGLLQRRELLLDRIADLEGQKESGKINEKKYKDELKELRFQLSKIIDQLGKRASPAKQH